MYKIKFEYKKTYYRLKEYYVQNYMFEEYIKVLFEHYKKRNGFFRCHDWVTPEWVIIDTCKIKVY